MIIHFFPPFNTRTITQSDGTCGSVSVAACDWFQVWVKRKRENGANKYSASYQHLVVKGMQHFWLICSKHSALLMSRSFKTEKLGWQLCFTANFTKTAEGKVVGWKGSGASCHYSSCNWSGHWSEVEGGHSSQNKERWVTWDSRPNLWDPAGKYYTDPCVHTETPRFTACINTPHTVLHMMLSVGNSCVCMSGSVHKYDEAKWERGAKRGKRTDSHTQTKTADYLRPVHSKSQ